MLGNTLQVVLTIVEAVAVMNETATYGSRAVLYQLVNPAYVKNRSRYEHICDS
jgi:hypothetical protein